MRSWSALTTFLLFIACGLPLLAQEVDPPPGMEPQEWKRIREESDRAREKDRKQAERINELAGNIRTKSDASAFVDEIALLFADQKMPYWFSERVKQRAAHAEYQSVTEGKLISEQRIADAFNRLMDDIKARKDLRVSAREVRALRAGQVLLAKILWRNEGGRNMWQIPDLHAMEGDRMAPGCRAVEAFKLLYTLIELPENIEMGRASLAKGVDPDEEVAKVSRESKSNGASQGAKSEARLLPGVSSPMRALMDQAKFEYVRKHGGRAFEDRLKEMFDRVIE